MATYAPQAATDAGLAATYNNAAGGGDKVPPGVLLHVKNTNASALTVTVITPATYGSDSSLTVADRTVSVPATTGERFIRLEPADLYRGGDGLVSLTWSVTSGVTFAVLS